MSVTLRPLGVRDSLASLTMLEARGELAGTVLAAGPFDEPMSPGVRASPWYLRHREPAPA